MTGTQEATRCTRVLLKPVLWLCPLGSARSPLAKACHVAKPKISRVRKYMKQKVNLYRTMRESSVTSKIRPGSIHFSLLPWLPSWSKSASSLPGCPHRPLNYLPAFHGSCNLSPHRGQCDLFTGLISSWWALWWPPLHLGKIPDLYWLLRPNQSCP